MATREDTTLVIKRDTDGQMRVTSTLWEDAKALARNEVLPIPLNSDKLKRFLSL
jgi:hypothetical protein